MKNNKPVRSIWFLKKRIKYNRNRKNAKKEKLKNFNEEEKLNYIENNRKLVKKHYNNNKEILALKKREYYLINKQKILKLQKDYRKNNPKEKNGKLGTGNYNITLVERHKEE